jgi:hypothetical protein
MAAAPVATLAFSERPGSDPLPLFNARVFCRCLVIFFLFFTILKQTARAVVVFLGSVAAAAMGVSQSTNVSDIETNVQTSILNTTNATTVTDNDLSMDQTGNTWDIENCGACFDSAQIATQSNQSSQYGVVANASQSLTDVSQSLLQSASSEVSGYGIGVASANNYASMLASVSTTVSNTTNSTMQSVNNAAQTSSNNSLTYTCPFSLLTWLGICGDQGFSVGQVSYQSNDATQTLDSSSNTELETTISQTADQSASATVSGINFAVLIIIGIIILVMIVMGIMGKGKVKLAGGYNGDFTRNGLMLLIMGVLFIVLGVISVTTRAPCSMNAQCATADWYNTGDCSCTDHYACADPALGLNRTPLTGVAPPLLFLSTIDSGNAASAQLYNTNLNRASVVAWVMRTGTESATTSTGANNVGYNMQTYQEMYAYATGNNSQMKSGATYLKPLLEYMARKVRTASGETPDDDGYSPVQYLYIPTDQTTAAQAPCLAEMVATVLPIEPYFLPSEFVDASSDMVQTGSAAPVVSLLQGKRKRKHKHKREHKHKHKHAQKVATLTARVPADPAVRRRVMLARRKANRRKAKQTPLGSVRRPAVRLIAGALRRTAPCRHCRKLWRDHVPAKAAAQATRARRHRHKLTTATAASSGVGAANLAGAFCYQVDDGSGHTRFKRKTKGVPCESATNQTDTGWKQMFMSNHAETSFEAGNMDVMIGGSTDQTKCQVQTNAYPNADPNTQRLYDINCTKDDSTITKINSCSTTFNFGIDHSDVNGGKSIGIAFANVDGTSGIRFVPTCHTLEDVNERTPFIARFQTNPSDSNQSYPGAMTRGIDSDYSSIVSGNYTSAISVESPATNGNALCRDAMGFAAVAEDDGNRPLMTGIVAGGGSYADGNSYFPPVASCAYDVPDISGDSNAPRYCDADNLGNCWTPVLCAHHGGVWSEVDCAADPSKDCYNGDTGAYCATAADEVCQAGECAACAQDECDGTTGCAWDSTSSTCASSCDTSISSCCNCSSAACDTDTCVLTGTGHCALGMDPCAAGAGDGLTAGSTCPALTSGNQVHYLVRIPEPFLSSYSGSNGCMPNPFIPSPNSVLNFVGDSSYSGTSDTYKNCAATSTGADGYSENSFATTTTTYESNCRYPTSNSAGSAGCYQSGTPTVTDAATGEAMYTWKVYGISQAARCYGLDGSSSFPAGDGASNYAAIPTNELSCWSAAQGSDTRALTLYYMFVRLSQWMLMYAQTASNTEYMLSMLGASTLMNGKGFVDGSDNQPMYTLESEEAVEDMINNNEWAQLQPLMIKTDSGNYEWCTLEDLYTKYGMYYMGQISNFVYDATAETASYPSTTVAMAKDGLGSVGGSYTDLADVAAQTTANSGMLVGTYGYCLNLFNNPVFTGVTFALGILLLIIMFIITFVRKNVAA